MIDPSQSARDAAFEITQADKDAVTAFHAIQIKRILNGDKTLGDNRDVIEQAFATHRAQAHARGRAEGLEMAAKCAEGNDAFPSEGDHIAAAIRLLGER